MNNGSKKPTRLIRSKIITIGDGAVGKTSIVRRYLGWGFEQRYLPTIGADFYTDEREYDLKEARLTVDWTVWDISGQPEFKEIRDKYYLGAGGSLVVFDITRKRTAENTKKWISEFFKKVNRNKPCVLIGNKIDLREQGLEEVPTEKGKQLAEELSLKYGLEIPYLETSAKTKKNLEKAFQNLAVKIAKNLGEL